MQFHGLNLPPRFSILRQWSSALSPLPCFPSLTNFPAGPLHIARIWDTPRIRRVPRVRGLLEELSFFSKFLDRTYRIMTRIGRNGEGYDRLASEFSEAVAKTRDLRDLSHLRVPRGCPETVCGHISCTDAGRARKPALTLPRPQLVQELADRYQTGTEGKDMSRIAASVWRISLFVLPWPPSSGSARSISAP